MASDKGMTQMMILTDYQTRFRCQEKVERENGAFPLIKVQGCLDGCFGS